MSDAYATLESLFERHHLLKSSADVLDWDAAVLLPAGAADLRGAQLAALRVVAHDVLAAPRVFELLGAADAEQAGLDAWQRANLALMRRAHVHAAAVPEDLVAARTRAASACEMTWRGARQDADFARLAPQLDELLQLTRQVAQAKSEALGVSPYEALADEYEPGLRTDDIDALFAVLGRELPPLVDAIVSAQASQPALVPLEGPFPAADQAELGRALAVALGFDFDRGRLDVSTHPFCGGSAEDVRMTTRFDEADFLSSVMSTVHETGHALYELGLPRAWVRQPVGQAVGMALHESQSLLVEMQACRSRELLGFLAPLAAKHLGAAASDKRAFAPDNLLGHARRVARGLVRVDADEATYPLHVVLRYRLERALVAGDLVVRDLPAAWNDGMRELLGVTPPDDRLGCLQDIHWPSGAFGYFPSYTMGAIAAAQIFATATAKDPGIRPALGRGDFAPLLAFLRAHVHGKGSLLGTQALLEVVTGRRLDAEGFLAHLRARYLEG